MTERHWSETVARNWLKQQGLRLLEGNYNTRFGEIDLIMTDGDNVVFVEVWQRLRPEARPPRRGGRHCHF